MAAANGQLVVHTPAQPPPTPEMAMVVKASTQEGRLGNMIDNIREQVSELMLSMRQGGPPSVLVKLCSSCQSCTSDACSTAVPPANHCCLSCTLLCRT